MTGIPGLHQVEPNVPPEPKSLAAKVTGRHFAALSYLVSMYAERTKATSKITATFGPGGDLTGVEIDGFKLRPGGYLYLHTKDGVSHLNASGEAHYETHYRKVGA